MLEQILENYIEEELLKADGFDDAIIGVDDSSMRLIYSVKKCIELLSIEMPEKDAYEFFSFNVSGAYVGEKTPIWCWDIFE
jgi:hypothetical protein